MSDQSPTSRGAIVRLGDTGRQVHRLIVQGENGRVLFLIDGEYFLGLQDADGHWSVDYKAGRKMPGGSKRIKDVPPKPKKRK